MTRAVRKRGDAATQRRFQWSHRGLRGQAPSINARHAKPVISVINIARTAGVSAVVLAQADVVQHVTNRWRSPTSSPTKEVINQPYPDTAWGIPMAAVGDKLGSGSNLVQ